jgi:hypothetical protein
VVNAGQRRLLNTVGAMVLMEAVFYSAIVPLLPHYASAEHLSKSVAGVLLGAYVVEGLAIGPAFGFALLMAAWAPGQLLGSVWGSALARSGR